MHRLGSRAAALSGSDSGTCTALGCAVGGFARVYLTNGSVVDSFAISTSLFCIVMTCARTPQPWPDALSPSYKCCGVRARARAAARRVCSHELRVCSHELLVWRLPYLRPADDSLALVSMPPRVGHVQGALWLPGCADLLEGAASAPQRLAAAEGGPARARSVLAGTGLPFVLARMGVDPANAGTSIQARRSPLWPASARARCACMPSCPALGPCIRAPLNGPSVSSSHGRVRG